MKEIEEAGGRLELLADSGCVSEKKMKALLDETRQLIAIFATIDKNSKGTNFSLQPSAFGLCYLGVASGNPPSTGMHAPVVGVCRVAKNRTALATCSVVTLAFSRLRLR